MPCYINLHFTYLLVLFECTRCATGCSVWTRKANTAAYNGVFYGFLSELNCMTECLKSLSCLAIDLGPHGCLLHHSVDDLAASYNVSGVTQLVLNRHCLPTSPLPRTSTVSIAAKDFTERTGMHGTL